VEGLVTETRCRFCESRLDQTLVDLGVTPLANSYLSADQIAREEDRFPLHARVCETCRLVQLDAVVDPTRIFSDYAYFSSYSDSWVEHAKAYASVASDRLGLGADSLVVEAASNDGYLLRHFCGMGVPVLGVEPAANVADVAIAEGIPTEVCFFGTETARSLVAQGRRADLFVANNVLAHVPELNDFVAGMRDILAPLGVVTVEVPHLLRLIEGVLFDTIYHEHYSYFSLYAVEQVLAAQGLAVFDVEELPTHGGSLRLWITHAARDLPPSPGLEAVRQVEAAAGIAGDELYRGFGPRVEACRDLFLEFLAGAEADGRTVVGYGAAAKGNTLLNYCGVTAEQLLYVVDRNPHKQGRYLPGSRIAIEAPERVAETKPDYLLVLPWNITAEVMEQMSDVRSWGGRFVVAVPTTRVLP
jgi:SAM-dependent methyltransferase